MERFAEERSTNFSDPSFIAEIDAVQVLPYSDEEYLRLLVHEAVNNRTCLFRDNKAKTDYVAVKVMTKQERYDDFVLEYKTLRVLNAQKGRLGLKSEYPVPLGIQSFAILALSMQETISRQAKEFLYS